MSEVPIGTFVLVLGQDAADKRWTPVVVNETLHGRKYARFTWMHPGCLEYLETGNDGPVVIGQTAEHEGAMATHTILVIGLLEYGVTMANLSLTPDGVDGWIQGIARVIVQLTLKR